MLIETVSYQSRRKNNEILDLEIRGDKMKKILKGHKTEAGMIFLKISYYKVLFQMNCKSVSSF